MIFTCTCDARPGLMPPSKHREDCALRRNETPTEIIAALGNRMIDKQTERMTEFHQHTPGAEPGRFAYVELRKVHIEIFDGATVNDLRRAQNFLSMLAEQLALGA